VHTREKQIDVSATRQAKMLDIGNFVDTPINLRYPEWQQPLQAALLEVNREVLKEKVAAAEAAILKRQQNLSRTPGDFEERNAIQDGLAILLTLKRSELDDPGWNANSK
jgi:hypothetical protein